jgi:hypothetical protein
MSSPPARHVLSVESASCEAKDADKVEKNRAGHEPIR